MQVWSQQSVLFIKDKSRAAFCLQVVLCADTATPGQVRLANLAARTRSGN